MTLSTEDVVIHCDPQIAEVINNLPMKLSYDGNEMEIGFNAKYLSDTLSVFSDGNVSLELNNELERRLNG